MKYSFTFDSVSAYQTAKATSSSNLYKALNTATSGTHDGKANADGALTRTAISTIKGDSGSYLTTDGRGQTFIDSVNLIVPREDGGEVGDTLLYKSSDGKYYWLKGRMRLSSTRSQNGSNCYVSSEITSAGYVFVGFVGHREGSRCLIFYNDPAGLGSAAWGTTAGQPLTSKILECGSGNDIAPDSVGLAAIEGYFVGASAEYSQRYAYPINRRSWNAMVEKIFKNESSDWDTTGIATYASGTQGWKVEASNTANIGTGTISVTVRSTLKTYDPANYNYDFEKWYNLEVAIRSLSPKSTSIMTELDGRQNTKILYNTSSTTYPIATACLAYAVSGVSDFGAGKWWWPNAREFWLMNRNMHLLKKKGIVVGGRNYWTSTQASSSSAISARDYGCFTNISQTVSHIYLPVTEFYV